MRMRQSLDDLERAFVEEISLERDRRRSLIKHARHRSFIRELERRRKQGSVRFVLLTFTLILTAVVVTIAMFRTLYVLLG